MAYDNYAKYSDAEDTYNTAKQNYQEATYQPTIDAEFATMQSAYDDMEKYNLQHKIFIVAAGGIWAWNMIDAFIWGGGKAEDYSSIPGFRDINLTANPQGIGISINF